MFPISIVVIRQARHSITGPRLDPSLSEGPPSPIDAAALPGPVVADVVAEDEPGAVARGNELRGRDGAAGGDRRGLVDQVPRRPGVPRLLRHGGGCGREKV